MENKEIKQLQKLISSKALEETNLDPNRWAIEPNERGNGRIITDMTTGISKEVGLFAFGSVLEVLETFFPKNSNNIKQ